MADPGAIELLASGKDVSFDELGLDSLALLTLATDLGMHGFAITEADVDAAKSVDGLVRMLLRTT